MNLERLSSSSKSNGGYCPSSPAHSKTTLITMDHYNRDPYKREEESSFKRRKLGFLQPKKKEKPLSKREVLLFFQWLRRLKSINNNQFYVMEVIHSYWGKDGIIYPKYERIAEQACVSVSTAKRICQEMRDRGFLNWRNERIGQRRTSNFYFFTITRKIFEKLLREIRRLENKARTAISQKVAEVSSFLKVSFRNRRVFYNYNKRQSLWIIQKKQSWNNFIQVCRRMIFLKNREGLSDAIQKYQEEQGLEQFNNLAEWRQKEWKEVLIAGMSF